MGGRAYWAGGGGTVETDATLEGDDHCTGDPLSLADDAVSTAKIASLSSPHRQDQ